MQSTLPYADLSLDDALFQFRREHELDAKYQEMRADAKVHFEYHDIVHVLFGLDTSIRQEAQADAWTLFGTDISWRDVKAFMDLPEEKELIKEVGWLTILKGYGLALADYPKIAWRSRKLRKKWRWTDNAAYRLKRVRDIRDEFGIGRALAG